MSEVLNIDFETYSDLPIKFGSFAYAMHPSTEVICIAYGFKKDNLKIWYPGMEPPWILLEQLASGGLISGWNVTFEYAILKYTCQRLYGWGAKLQIHQVRCTQADALALSLPAGLGDCAVAFETVDQKDKKGKALITKLCKPRKPTKNKPYTRVTKEIDPEAFEEMYDYCFKDVITEIAIAEKLPRKLGEKELELFHLTLKMNERGIPVDMELVDSVLSAKAIYEKRLNEEIYDLTGGELSTTNSRPRSLKWLADSGLELASYTKKDIRDALDKDDIKPEVRRFLEIRSELSRTPIKKFDFIKNAVCSDNTIKNNVIYHKATTGRFAGTGFQIQNLPRDTYENPEELIQRFKAGDIADLDVYNAAIMLIRPAICAHPGKKLVVSDFSSIENRKTAWIAEDWKTLEEFEKGMDQYKSAAADIYDTTYDEVSKDQRQLGKIAVLACGFGGGHKTFRTVCADSWGINLSEDLAKFIVEGYREKYYKVVQLWYGLYDAAIEALTTKNVTSFNSIKFRVMADFLYMRLPSGRLIAYFKPELRMVMTPWGQEKLAITHMGTNTYTRKWERLTVIPGRLTENVVQATARDSLTEAMVRIENAGYEIVGCVHDEIIAHVDVNFGSIEEFDDLMKIKPHWALDCPVDCEGFSEQRYRK